ncbi:antibiotic biosynthesis monooxygenase [Cellulomonas cellasea]|jgi:heme-degrading monooxygenase HmoA|uniref:Heme-degrading monooxygenase HmoA n=1 Tax=Cellulomonas cellasea TaxID=43670 RepID=A0A7W4YBF1_9CELL|nr:antibiotic biosynthesis monooxygenase [Cellulomonas cellasea]MBB2923618.1 heme-degrading monooxygenase HmoA [Cellulomonas cellasea]
MILEHALLPVDPARAEEFEAAFAEALPIISAMPGVGRVTLSRGVESPGTYLLLVGWETVEHHTEGFRGSAGYARWRELLHRFYDPFPVVEHFTPVLAAEPGAASAPRGESGV